MVGVMVMTPVHMGHAGGPEGTTLRIIGLVISVHVAGMYLFSPLVGLLADRAGRRTTVAVGGGSAARRRVLAGTAPPGAASSWSRAAAARARLVLRADRRIDAGHRVGGAELRPTAQGGTDLLMGLGAAVAGAVGGPLLAVGGLGCGLGRWSSLAVVWRRVLVVPRRRGQQDDRHQRRRRAI